MALVGAATRERSEHVSCARCSGCPATSSTSSPGCRRSRSFGRAKAQAQAIAQVTDRYRVATLRSLRLAFLSSLILELVATVSVALVAVAIGLRLMDGQLDLRDGAVRARARARGLPAAAPRSAPTTTPAPRAWRRSSRSPRCSTRRRRWRAARGRDVPDPARAGLSVEGLTVAYPGRGVPALRRRVAERRRGGGRRARRAERLRQVDAAAACCSGWWRPRRGTVRIGDADLAELDPDAWRARLAWVPQRPHLFAASIADNVRLGRRDATDDAGRRRARAAGLARCCRPAARRRRDRCSASAAPGCRPASASASRSRGRSCATRRCCCSTSRPRTSTATPSARCSTRSARLAAGTHGDPACRPPPGAAGAGRPRRLDRPRSGGGRGVSAEPQRPAARHARARAPGRRAPGVGDAARRRLGGGGDRADRHLGVADLARVAAPARVGARARPSSPCSSSPCRAALLRYGERLVGHDAALPRARRPAGRRLRAPRAPRPARRAGLPQRRPAGAARRRRRLAPGPAAARRAAVRDRGARRCGDRRAGLADAAGRGR